MLDLPGEPVLDKVRLIGGCARLPLRVDAAALAAEVAALDPSSWGSRGGRVGYQRVAEAVFLRGHAPAEGELPIEDRAPLAQLPQIRALIEQRIGGRPQRALLARLPAGAIVAPHVDQAPYFAKCIRIHVPIVTHEGAWMLSGETAYHMRAGEVWALNNSAMHAVWNSGEAHARTHLICDFLPAPQLDAMLASAERDLGAPRPDLLQHVRRIVQGGGAMRE